MPEYVVAVVTIADARAFVPLETPTFETLPHLTRRARGATAIEGGVKPRQLTQFRGRVFQGSLIADFLAEPKLILFPDVHAPKSMWRFEFRRDVDARYRLDERLKEGIRSVVAEQRVEIEQFWINPGVRGGTQREVVNLVLASRILPGQDPGLRFRSQEGALIVSW